jgi:hypothetical protein
MELLQGVSGLLSLRRGQSFLSYSGEKLISNTIRLGGAKMKLWRQGECGLIWA